MIIVNVASIAHWDGKLDWGNLQGEKHYSGFEAYATSKLELILFTYALALRLKGTNVTCNCLHPGVIMTKLLRAGMEISPETPLKAGQEPPFIWPALQRSRESQGNISRMLNLCTLRH